MFWKLFAAYGALVATVLVAVGILFSRQLRNDSRRDQEVHLRASAERASPAAREAIQDPTNAEIKGKLTALAETSDARITVLDRDGVIVADTDPSANREGTTERTLEIAALEGAAVSVDLRQRGRDDPSTLYLAMRIERDGQRMGAIRLSAPLEQGEAAASAWWRELALVGVAAMSVAALLAYRYSSRLTELSSTAHEIVRGDYDKTIDVSYEDELGRLARSFHQMRQELRQQIDGLERVRQDLQTMLETIPEAVLAIDSQQRILFANPSTYPLFGLPSTSIVGQKLWEVLRHPRLQEAINSAFASADPFRTEFEILSPPRVLEFRARRLTVKGGRAIIIVLHDISELRRLERLRQDFFANVSHELKTPLASIKAYTETLLEPDVDDRDTQHRFLKRIEEQADRLHALVIDMLMLARVESEDHGFETRPVDVHQVAHDVVRAFAGEADGKGIALSLDCQGEDRHAQADPEGVFTLLSNLVDNAIKYTPNGGQVGIAVKREVASLVIAVSDSGMGIPHDDLRRIFERFYRVDKARSRELGGTGLGLSIVKHLAQRFGGTVNVTSRLKHGSTFSVALPLADGTNDAFVAVPAHNLQEETE